MLCVLTTSDQLIGKAYWLLSNWVHKITWFPCHLMGQLSKFRWTLSYLMLKYCVDVKIESLIAYPMNVWSVEHSKPMTFSHLKIFIEWEIKNWHAISQFEINPLLSCDVPLWLYIDIWLSNTCSNFYLGGSIDYWALMVG
jgi:hypothetical protein